MLFICTLISEEREEHLKPVSSCKHMLLKYFSHLGSSAVLLSVSPGTHCLKVDLFMVLFTFDSCSFWEQSLRTLAGGELRVEGLSDEETCSTHMVGGGVPDLLVTSVESGYCGYCGSTSLFGFSCAGTCQISDQSHAIGKLRRNITSI